MLPFVQIPGQPGLYEADRRSARARVVPTLSLGVLVKLKLAPPHPSRGLVLHETQPASGGLLLKPITLTEAMFAADQMIGPFAVELREMKVKQLMAELGAREEPKAGRKPNLQRRLRAVLIRKSL